MDPSTRHQGEDGLLTSCTSTKFTSLRSFFGLSSASKLARQGEATEEVTDQPRPTTPEEEVEEEEEGVLGVSWREWS